jgi:hypothetical protein
MWKPVLLTLGALIVALIAIELLARSLGLTPELLTFRKPANHYAWSMPDDVLGWINRPGTSLAEQPGHAPMTFLDHGRRVSMPVDKPAAPSRIMVVGCSFTQGFGVTDAETYVYQLNKRFPAIDLENFATGGYGTVQSMMMADRQFSDFYRAAKPNLVVYGLIPDHINRNLPSAWRIIALRDPAGRYMVQPHAALAGNGLQLQPFDIVDTWPLEAKLSIVALTHRGWFYLLHAMDWVNSTQLTIRILKQFDAMVKAHDTKFLVVILAGGKKLDGPILKNSGLTYVDCTYPEVGKDRTLRVGGIGHPSAKLHAYWAGCIGDWIDRHPLE